MARALSLVIRNLLFTVAVPGLGGPALRRRFGGAYLEYRRTVPPGSPGRRAARRGPPRVRPRRPGRTQ